MRLRNGVDFPGTDSSYAGNARNAFAAGRIVFFATPQAKCVTDRDETQHFVRTVIGHENSGSNREFRSNAPGKPEGG